RLLVDGRGQRPHLRPAGSEARADRRGRRRGLGLTNRFDVAGLRTVVTGAASGLGLAMAEGMAEGGARVTLVDVDASGLAAAASHVPGASTAVVDVSDSGAVARLFAEVDGVDVVFANAGV